MLNGVLLRELATRYRRRCHAITGVAHLSWQSRSGGIEHEGLVLHRVSWLTEGLLGLGRGRGHIDGLLAHESCGRGGGLLLLRRHVCFLLL